MKIWVTQPPCLRYGPSTFTQSNWMSASSRIWKSLDSRRDPTFQYLHSPTCKGSRLWSLQYDKVKSGGRSPLQTQIILPRQLQVGLYVNPKHANDNNHTTQIILPRQLCSHQSLIYQLLFDPQSDQVYIVIHGCVNTIPKFPHEKGQHQSKPGEIFQ